MTHGKRLRSRFQEEDGDPMAAMATLVDVMLVFACGLLAALVLGQRYLQGQQDQEEAGTPVEKTRTLPQLPAGSGHLGTGYQSVGRVFRDPKTGKLVLVESE